MPTPRITASEKQSRADIRAALPKLNTSNLLRKIRRLKRELDLMTADINSALHRPVGVDKIQLAIVAASTALGPVT